MDARDSPSGGADEQEADDHAAEENADDAPGVADHRALRRVDMAGEAKQRVRRQDEPTHDSYADSDDQSWDEDDCHRQHERTSGPAERDERVTTVKRKAYEARQKDERDAGSGECRDSGDESARRSIAA